MSTKNQKASKVLEDISGKKLTLGSYLWSIRMGEELTQADFATHLGVSRLVSLPRETVRSSRD